MIKNKGVTCFNFKKIDIFRLLVLIFAILLIPAAFQFRGMVAGLMGLLLVVLATIICHTRGGLISAIWASSIMLLTIFVSPVEGETIHMVGGITTYFVIAFGLGRHLEMIRNNHQEINSKNDALIREKKQLEALFNISFDAIVFLDKNHIILDVNKHFMQLFGYTSEEIIGVNIDELLNKGQDGSANIELTHELMVKGDQILVESTRYGKYGQAIQVVIKAVPIIIDSEIIGGYVIYDDITYRKYYEDQLRHLSFHDQLTNLYNRSFFEQFLTQLSDKNEYPISIITADLNGLKLINDTIGHQSGDELLQASANILKSAARDIDKVFRIGGDEFAIVLPLTGEEDCYNIVNEIRTSIGNYNANNPQISVSLSIGASTAKDKDISLKEVFKRADDLMYREKLYEGTSVRAQLVNALMATLAERDHITEGHAQRLDDLCLAIGKKSGLSPHRLANLTLLSQVHDLGKVGIPDNILCKPGPLTELEWELMRLHPEKGYRIALSSPDLSGVADLILRHHEKWDGTGYPLGIKGEEIPLECRILSIVDSFDAMTNDRPYSKARSKEQAVEEIQRCSGTQFDPSIVDIFLSVLE